MNGSNMRKMQTSSNLPVKTDHAVFISKSKPDLSFFKKLLRYQNSEILLSLHVIALSDSNIMCIRSL